MALTDFFANVGGLNLTDSPLYVKDNMAVGQSWNYDYAETGAITKVLGHAAINSSADAQLRSLGFAKYLTTDSATRTLLRCAGTKIQTVSLSLGTFTNQTEDTTTAGSDFLASGSEQPVISSPFNAATGAVTWLAGGGMSSLYGYNGTKVTKNGADVATGTITATPSATGGSFSATGTYRYAVVLRKASTQANSNAALDTSATISATSDKVTIDLTGLTSLDTTKYDQIWIYRSAVGGAASFTTGDLIAQVASTATSYVDTGTSIASTQNVPRAGATVDNSVLPSGTYETVCSFKRRLITASGSTFYISDTDKPESWPNEITIPTGGKIVGMLSIGFNSPFSTGADEYLCIWKENELWILTGTGPDDWELKFVDSVGLAGPALVVPINSFVTWVGHRGIYLWDGASKPIYASRLLEGNFRPNGDLDKPKFNMGWGTYHRNTSTVEWRLSHRTQGENKVSIKMDARLTVPQTSQGLDTRQIDGVFTQSYERSLYAGLSFTDTGNDEFIVAGDAAGYAYKMYRSSTNPGSTGISFSYETRPLDMGKPSSKKRYKKVVAWVDKLVLNDLTLYYWTDFRASMDSRSKVVAPMTEQVGTDTALYDVAFWDVAFWDDYLPNIVPVTFYLHSNENNAEGDTLKLRFEQTEGNAPVVLHGFSVEWEEIGDVR